MKILTLEDKIYSNWMFDELEHTSLIDESDIIVFTGGEDVSPDVYGESRVHKLTNSNKSRDNKETYYFEKGFESNKFMIGICRGLN